MSEKKSFKVKKVGNGAPAQQVQRNAKKFEVKRWNLRDLGKAQSVMIVWTVSAKSEIPFGLEYQEYEEGRYTTERVGDVLEKGGGISEEEISKQRHGIMDTGREIAEVKQCQGGILLYNKLIGQGWKISDAHWEHRLTEQDKAKGKGQPKKYRVKLELSKTVKVNGGKLNETALKGLMRLLRQTWGFCHVWDNTKVRSQNFVFSFGWLMRDTDAQRVIDLQLSSEEQAERLNPISA